MGGFYKELFEKSFNTHSDINLADGGVADDSFAGYVSIPRENSEDPRWNYMRYISKTNKYIIIVTHTSSSLSHSCKLKHSDGG